MRRVLLPVVCAVVGAVACTSPTAPPASSTTTPDASSTTTSEATTTTTEPVTSTTTTTTTTAPTTTTTVAPGPRTLAIAYTDRDGAAGYSEGVDVLIARLIDSNDDGVPSSGDRIQTDRFPKDPQRSAFGEFGTKEWVVASVVAFDATRVSVTSARGDFPPSFIWYERAGFDMYVEQEWDQVAETWFRTDKIAPFACPSSGNRMQVQRTQSNPNHLQSTPLCQAPPNGALLTVEIGS